MRTFILRLLFHSCVACCAGMLVALLCAAPALADGAPASSLAPAVADYRCDLQSPFHDGLAPAEGWQSGTPMVTAQALPCWLRITPAPAQAPVAPNVLSLAVPWGDVALFDAHGRLLASADHLGVRNNALISGGHFIFPVDGSASAPLYARVTLTAGAPAPVSLDRVALSAAVSAGQEHDAIVIAEVAALLLVAAMTALFSLTLRDGNYAWYALYTFSIAVYSMDAESALFGWLWQRFDSLFFLFMAADVSIGVTATVMVARTGNFSRHSPRLYRFLMLLLLLYLPLFVIALLGRFELFNRVNAVFDTIWYPIVLAGLWRGWRKGERSCGLLFLGELPNAIYWVPAQVPVALGIDASWTPLPPPEGLMSVALLLLLPAVYCYTLVERSLSMRRANIRLKEETDRMLINEIRLNAQREAAESAALTKSTFLAAASHDLRQPMHALGLFLASMRRTALDARQSELVEHIEASSNAAREMLDTLLDFSKLEAGSVVARPVHFPLQTLLRKLENEFAPLANAKDLLYRSRDTLAVAHADPGLVELILRNLISNATRYTRRGGLLIACRRRGDRIAVEVWDTGIGIPASQHSEIFREFYQLHNPERDRNKGLGLGLAIVDGLARTMGLQIELHSTPGRGSVFRLYLPAGTLQSEAPAPQPQPAGADLAAVDGRRILLVEDDQAVRIAMQELLQGWGGECRAFESIEEALAALDSFVPDLLITDFRLREKRTGRDVIVGVMARLGRSIPAIIVTGDTAPERLRDAQASGALLLHKPVAPAALLAAMQSLLGKPVAVAAAD